MVKGWTWSIMDTAFCYTAPEVAQSRNVFKIWAGATCPSNPPTLAVDNDPQLLKVETLLGDGTSSPTGRLIAKTDGTPGPLLNTTQCISALSAFTFHNNTKVKTLH